MLLMKLLNNEIQFLKTQLKLHVLVVEQKSSKKNHINSKALFTKVFQKAHTKYHNSKLYYYRKRT